MDPTDDLMLAPDQADPQQLLETLLSISSAPAAAKTGATASTFPTHRRMPGPMPMPAPIPMTPPTGDPAASGGGTDWRALLRLIAPAIGSLVAGGGHASPHFWAAYQGQQAEMDQQRQRQQLGEQNKRKAAADFLMEFEKGAEQRDDPAQLAQYVDAGDEAGALLGYFKPGEIKARGYRVPESKIAEKSLKELTDLVDGAIKGGYDPEQLIAAKATLARKNGPPIPFETAYDLVHPRPVGADNKPIAKPPKPAKETAGTEKERAAQLLEDINAARLAGDTAKAKSLQTKYDNLVKVTTDLGAAGRSPVDPDIADMNKTLKQLQIDGARTRANGGNEQLIQVTDTDPETGEQVTSLVPKKAGEVSRKPAKEPTQGQYTAGTYAGRMAQAEDILTGQSGNIANMNWALFKAQQVLPAAAQSGGFQSYDQAARNFVNAVLRRESGAAISEAEFDNARKQYLPQPGDTPQTLSQKKANRIYAFETMKKAAGRGYEPPIQPPAAGGPGPRTPNVGDVVTVKGQRVRVTKIGANGQYEGVPVP